jgi:hypothetical protein
MIAKLKGTRPRARLEKKLVALSTPGGKRGG